MTIACTTCPYLEAGVVMTTSFATNHSSRTTT